MGDVTSIFLSLTQGIKDVNLNQLSSLGLIINSEAVYVDYAAAVGKSVDALSQQDRQLALLNGTLASGNELIRQAGGSTATAANNYERFGAAMSNAGKMLKEDLFELFDPMVAYLADQQEHANQVAEAMDILGLTYTRVAQSAGEAEASYRLSNKEIKSESEILEEAAQKLHDMAFAEQEAAEMAHAYALSQRDAVSVTEDFSESLGKVSAEAITWQQINTSLVDTMQSQLELIQLEALGYGDLQEQWNGLLAQYDAGLISLAELESAQEGISIAALLAQASLEEMSSDEVISQMKELGAGTTTIANAVKFLEGNHKFSLKGLIEITSKGVDIGSALALATLSLGQRRAIEKELVESATGGPLTDLSLVGEEGPELIIDGIVIPTRETRKLMSLGLLPRRRYALGGPLGGGGPVSSLPAPDDFDPLNLEQRRLLRGENQRTGGRIPRSTSTSHSRPTGGGRRSTAEAASLSATIQHIVQASLATVVPQAAAVAAQAAGAVAPASLSAANAQMSRELNRSLESSNDRLLVRVDRLILETRRMKTYFRDAVRLVSD
ncbi:MAG: hypothetical protein O3B43_06500 [Chloroflexi bacterium]|nr:hypothetical protein [Chloroflexota bacterium]